MIAVDTSALMAILLDEDLADACVSALCVDDGLLISAGTVAEALIVADRRGVGVVMRRLINELGFEVVPVTASAARLVGEAYRRWGRGAHPAGLNFGDCFAYVTARDHECPLLYVGEDFRQTDVAGAL